MPVDAGRADTMHDNQIHLDPDTARELIVQQYPRYRSMPIERHHGSGTDNAIFRLGYEAAARFPLRRVDPQACAARLRGEAAAMAEFAQHCPFPAPRPIGYGRPGARYPMPWSVQTWIVGEVATPQGLARSHMFALDLVTLITTLRAVDAGDRSYSGIGRGGDLRDHDDWMAVCFSESERLLDVPRLRTLWTRFRDVPPCGPDVMSHKDLIPANLIVRDDRLAGVLDTGGFGPADPALDLVAAWHLLDRAERHTVRRSLGASAVEWSRGAAWAFQQAMGLVWYYEKTNPDMSALGRSTLDRLLDDPDL